MDLKEIKSKVNDGYIHARAIIEVLGRPKEHVEETLKGYIKKLKVESEIIFIKEEYEEPEATEDLFAGFSEVEILTKDAKQLMEFCFDYMPSSVEVIEPDHIIYKSADFTDFLNDVQARLHAVNMGTQEFKSKNKNLIRNTAVLLDNFVFYAVQTPRTLEELQKIVGIGQDQIKKVLETHIEKGRVEKDGDRYSMKK